MNLSQRKEEKNNTEKFFFSGTGGNGAQRSHRLVGPAVSCNKYLPQEKR